ncbi:MAG: GNAT family N-acetyltransferase [Bdellovibrionota bacterium]
MQKNYPKEFLEGERIFLRRHEIATAPVMFACVNADRDRLKKFLPWVEGTKTVRDSEEYIRATQVDWQEQNVFDFGIYRKSDRVFLGSIGSHNLVWLHERCEIGYWISGSEEGKGLVSEAVGLLEQEMFRIGFHRIEIRCDALNIRSAAVPKRSGYELEGTLKEHTIEFGRRRDTAVWAKLRQPK